tara:strand:+ start:56 stop:727 length:672 start_codon:yes stop_codon:yes gene_type:complete
MPKTKKDKKAKKETNTIDENQIVIINNIQPPQEETSELRTINLYGDISEQKGSEIVGALLYFQNSAFQHVLEDPKDENSALLKVSRPIKLYISTHGGTASDMFSILDVMAMIKKETCDICTYGVGKVMSAGVPILAAGTPGMRKVGKNCRIMLHSVMAGTGGTIFSMENELEEIKWIQERYIECLASSTKMTKAKIRKMLKTQRDVYISAEEAINLGIADEII